MNNRQGPITEMLHFLKVSFFPFWFSLARDE